MSTVQHAATVREAGSANRPPAIVVPSVLDTSKLVTPIASTEGWFIAGEGGWPIPLEEQFEGPVAAIDFHEQWTLSRLTDECRYRYFEEWDREYNAERPIRKLGRSASTPTVGYALAIAGAGDRLLRLDGEPITEIFTISTLQDRLRCYDRLVALHRVVNLVTGARAAGIRLISGAQMTEGVKESFCARNRATRLGCALIVRGPAMTTDDIPDWMESFARGPFRRELADLRQ